MPQHPQLYKNKHSWFLWFINQSTVYLGALGQGLSRGCSQSVRAAATLRLRQAEEAASQLTRVGSFWKPVPHDVGLSQAAWVSSQLVAAGDLKVGRRAPRKEVTALS